MRNSYAEMGEATACEAPALHDTDQHAAGGTAAMAAIGKLASDNRTRSGTAGKRVVELRLHAASGLGGHSGRVVAVVKALRPHPQLARTSTVLQRFGSTIGGSLMGTLDRRHFTRAAAHAKDCKGGAQCTIVCSIRDSMWQVVSRIRRWRSSLFLGRRPSSRAGSCWGRGRASPPMRPR